MFGSNESKKRKSSIGDMEFKPRAILEDLLKATSGSSVSRDISYSVYFKMVGFKGVKEGIGTSTLVASVAIALAKLGLSVCVLDTSILTPSQAVLLNVGDSIKKDWLDLPHTNENIVDISKRNGKVHLLSFKSRGLVDFVSTTENEDLVNIAMAQLSSKYDIFLVDLSNEPSSVSTTCMQMCNKVIQVWNNSAHAMSCISTRIEDCITCCCSLDKMSYVVTSNVVDDIKTDWQTIFDKYKVRRIGNMPMSLEVARVLAMGKLPYDYPSKSEGIKLYNDFVLDVVTELVQAETEIENFSGKKVNFTESVVSAGVVVEEDNVLKDEITLDSSSLDEVDDFNYDYPIEKAEDYEDLDDLDEGDN